MNWHQCHIEQSYNNNHWYICWPDGSRAWDQGYKTRGWAKRTLNWLKR